MTSLLHQCGHNTAWNIASFGEDHCGDGLILSPVHMSMDRLIDLNVSLKNNSLFDPQYYLPNSQKAKLNTYDFFPESISGGFVTADFSLIALDSARRCVEFQMEQGFERLIIPARYFSDMITDYTDRQDVYTVHPFLRAIDELRYADDVFLTLPLTRGMVMDKTYRNNLLNWVTSYQRINGVYLLVDDNRTTKQIQDEQYLRMYLTTVKELTDVGLQVIVGHANTEGVLFTLIDNCEITFGGYENTRIFSIDKFVVTDEERRGPRARIYLPGLMNWIQYSQATQIKDQLPALWHDVHFETEYAKTVLAAPGEPHFGAPGLYKHFFLAYADQVSQLSSLPAVDRYNLIRRWLRSSIHRYEEIADVPIDLDIHGAGGHIQIWLDVINWYYATYLK